MKILHFNEFGSTVGGVERYIADISNALASAGHETVLVSFAPEDASKLMPGTVQIVASRTEVVLAGIDRVMDDFRPDVAYVHAVYDPQVIHWILSRLPAIAYIHSPYLVCPGYALFLRRSSQVCGRTAGPGCVVNAQIERCCFGRNPIHHVRRLRQVRSLLEATSKVDALVGSEFMRRQLIANGLSAQRVSVLAPFLVNESVSEYTRTSDPTVILFGGRVTAEKGLRQLIEALKSLQADWQLIVAGDGPDRAACEQLAERLDIAQRIEFAGWVEPAQMKALYQRCAFVVMPSLGPEGFGRIGPEAFVHGRPVVAYAVGGIPDWLEDGETGYLAVPGDVNSLSLAIARLIENPDDQERMGQTARERAGVHWNAETHVQKLVACFQAAIRGFDDGTSNR